MKTTYLINRKRSDGSTRLSVATPAEWRTAVKENKELSAEQKRYFILDFIADGDELDCMVIETPREEYLCWDREHTAGERNRELEKAYQFLSINAPLTDLEDSGSLLDLITSETQVESTACDLVLMDELKKALASWKPWAVDLLECYLQGEKRTCTETLSKKYGVSSQVVRKYKRQFEDFAKKFFGGVSF